MWSSHLCDSSFRASSLWFGTQLTADKFFPTCRHFVVQSLCCGPGWDLICHNIICCRFLLWSGLIVYFRHWLIIFTEQVHFVKAVNHTLTNILPWQPEHCFSLDFHSLSSLFCPGIELSAVLNNQSLGRRALSLTLHNWIHPPASPPSILSSPLPILSVSSHLSLNPSQSSSGCSSSISPSCYPSPFFHFRVFLPLSTRFLLAV